MSTAASALGPITVPSPTRPLRADPVLASSASDIMALAPSRVWRCEVPCVVPPPQRDHEGDCQKGGDASGRALQGNNHYAVRLHEQD